MAKTALKADIKADPPVGKSRKKLFLTLGLAFLILGGAGAAGWYFTHQSSGHKETAKGEPAKAPVFANLDAFTVNLQPENGDQYLQATLTLQVADQAQVDLIKQHMPLVRNRILILLSSKKASEISTTEGKKQLTDEIIAQVRQPFYPQGVQQSISGVYLTSFVIQ